MTFLFAIICCPLFSSKQLPLTQEQQFEKDVERKLLYDWGKARKLEYKRYQNRVGIFRSFRFRFVRMATIISLWTTICYILPVDPQEYYMDPQGPYGSLLRTTDLGYKLVQNSLEQQNFDSLL